MRFDTLQAAITCVYVFEKRLNNNCFESQLINLYLQADQSCRVRISKGFPYIAEALALAKDKGDALFIEYGLMAEVPVDDESENTTDG